MTAKRVHEPLEPQAALLRDAADSYGVNLFPPTKRPQVVHARRIELVAELLELRLPATPTSCVSASWVLAQRVSLSSPPGLDAHAKK
jgi:hypothetical protein